MFTYSTKGTCSRQILFDVDAENKLHNVRFIGGCGGKDIDDIQALLCGIRCRNGTSCPDQLSKAIAEYKTERENAAAEK